MPIPKELKSALDAWKAGTGEYPEALDHGVFFPNDGAFQAEVGRKAKGRESQARDAAIAKILSEVGLTDESQIAELKETLEKSGVLKTDHEKTKAELAKERKAREDALKEFDALKANHAQLNEKLKGVAKRDALLKYAGQVVDPEEFSNVIGRHLEVGEDGAVVVKGDGKKTLDELVKETLTAKPYFKNPTFKEGTGTKETPAKPDTNNVLPFKVAKEGDNLPLGQQILNQLVANGEVKNPFSTPGGP